MAIESENLWRNPQPTENPKIISALSICKNTCRFGPFSFVAQPSLVAYGPSRPFTPAINGESPIRILGLQLQSVWEDQEANFRRVGRLLEAHAPPRGSLVVLPEMFAVGFTMNVEAVAEAPDGRTASFLGRIASEHQMFALGGAVTRGPGGLGWNEALAFAPDGRELARYRKLHPFTFAGEAERYAPGGEVVLFEWGAFAVAPFICYDLRFPEAFRLAVLGGARLLTVIANWPAARASHWRLLLRARAVENQAYVIGVNRCGRDPHHEYSGESMIIDPLGEIVAEVGAEEGVVSADLTTETVEGIRNRFPVLGDGRRELLGRIRVRTPDSDGTIPADKKPPDRRV